MPGVAQPRHARAVALAVASFGLGLAGHLEAGGHSGHPAALMIAAGYCALSGWTSSRRRLSGAGLVAVLLGNQLLLHVTLVLATAWSGGAGTGTNGATGMPATGMPATGMAVTEMAVAGMARMSADCVSGGAGTGSLHLGAGAAGGIADHSVSMAMPLVPGPWMLLAHLSATLLTAAVLLAVQAVCLGLATLAHWLDRVVQIAGSASLDLPRPVRGIGVLMPGWTTRPVGARPGRGPPRSCIVW